MPAPDALTTAANPLRLRYLDSPLPGWLRAAGEALLGLLPSGLRQRIVMQEKILCLRLRGDELELRAMAGARALDLGCLPLDGEALAALRIRLDAQTRPVPRWLLLDGRQVLRRVLSLPAAAEPRLREVLRHEIDRQTPFGPEQVAFEARILARDPVQKLLQVELLALPNARLDAALAQLGALAEGLAGVDVQDGADHRLGVNLLPPARRQRRGERDAWLRWGLIAGAVLLLWLAMLQTLDNRREALTALNARIVTADRELHEARKLSDQLRTSQQATAFLSRTRAQQPTLTELLLDLTRRIPDTTALEKLAVNQGKIVMIGQSQEAPALVGLLQGSPVLRTPALAGAVQRDPRTGRDRFTLTANLAGTVTEANDGRR
jgi:general secretion pathway protein L